MIINISRIIALFFLVFNCTLAADELINIAPDQLLALKDKNAVIIDIRTEKEWSATGIIPDSRTMEFFDANGKSDSELWLKHLSEQITTPGQPVILVCRSGNRSRIVGDYLVKQQGMKNIYHLEHGIKSWINEGKTTEPPCLNTLACI